MVKFSLIIYFILIGHTTKHEDCCLVW